MTTSLATTAQQGIGANPRLDSVATWRRQHRSSVRPAVARAFGRMVACHARVSPLVLASASALAVAALSDCPSSGVVVDRPLPLAS
jgi:hypothetical protein